MHPVIAALASVDFLTASTSGVVEEFASAGRPVEVPRGHVFWNTGQRPQGIVVPVGGELASSRTDAGGHQICYDLVGPGECAGVACALDGLPHPDEVRAIRAGEFFAMDRPAFVRFLGAHPGVRRDAADSVIRMFRRSLVERDRMTLLTVNQRFVRFLLERACVRWTDGARILLRATHAELAPRLGSVREVVARACSSLIARGLIRRTRHALFVADRAGLVAEAGLDRDDTAPGFLATDAAARTRRFFLPVFHESARLAAEARICAEQVRDPAACAAKGCPIAATRRALTSAGQRERTHAAAERARTPHAHAADGAPRDRAEEHSSQVRTPLEKRTVARRVETYRARAATIESRFGDESHVPTKCSVFVELVNAGD